MQKKAFIVALLSGSLFLYYQWHWQPKFNDTPSASMPEQSTEHEQEPLEISLEEPKQPQSVQKITVVNGITKKMIGYRKACMTYTPEFSLEINGVTVKPMGEYSFDRTDDATVLLTYHYNFLGGYRIGSKSVRVQLPPTGDRFTVTFSWQNDHRVIVSDAVGYYPLAESSS